MSVNQQTCFTVACDDCKKPFEHDYEPHWPSAREAIDEALNSGEWWGGERLLVCDRCRYLPHHPVPDGNCCARCGIDRDDHDAYSPTT